MDTLEAISPVAPPRLSSGGSVSAREEKPFAMTSVPAGRPEDGPSRSEEDRRLLIRYHRHGDRAAREQLVQRLLPLARRINLRSPVNEKCSDFPSCDVEPASFSAHSKVPSSLT